MIHIILEIQIQILSLLQTKNSVAALPVTKRASETLQGWWIGGCKSATDQCLFSNFFPNITVCIKNSSFEKLALPDEKKKVVKILVSFLHYSTTDLNFIIFIEFSGVLNQLTLYQNLSEPAKKYLIRLEKWGFFKTHCV